MNYIVIINNDIITCATNKYVLSDKEVIELQSAKKVLELVTVIKEEENQKIDESIKSGYEKGFKEGLTNAQDVINAQFVQYLKDLSKQVFDNSSETDNTVINMACEITRKIAEDIESNEMLFSLVKTALKKLKKHKSIEIKVRPEYVEELKVYLSKVHSNEVTIFTTIEIIADETLASLDCIIKTDAGVTVASFNDQLNILEENIIKVVN